MATIATDLFDLPDPSADKVASLIAVAGTLAARIATGEAIDRAALAAAMTDRFAVTDATGAWSMRDAYDALEVAQVMVIRAIPADHDATAMLGRLQDMARLLPTQSYRSEEQVARQQFSTPLPLAYIAASACQAGPFDTVLEPSAGTGMLAAWIAPTGAKLVLNEIDGKRAGLLRAVFGDPVTMHDAAYVADLLQHTPRVSTVLMNPPFSRSEGRGEDMHAGARHLLSALRRLAAHGRCVAIMPAWFATARSGRDGYAAVGKVMAPRLDMLIEGSAFARHGTGIDVRVLIYDRDSEAPTERLATADLAEALQAVTACRRALAASVPAPTPTPAPLKPATAATLTARAPILPARHPGAGGLFAKPAARPSLAPRVVTLADTEAKPLGYAVLAEPRAAEPPVGIYVPYRVARLAIDGAASHPTPLVESIAMASILPPVPTYRPVLPPSAAAALSDAQAETVIHAGQAFARDLPGRFRPNEAGTLLEEHAEGSAYRQGYFLGDGTGAGKGRQVAAIIFDSWCQGRRKALWVSKTTSLLEDARRDWSALGGVALDIQPLDAFPMGTSITMNDGILFVTYATLRSQRHDEASRLQQILAWLGDEHDGMIVFDEAHAMANAAGTETQFGTQKGSEQGLAGVRLQNRLPRARILYVSATGATDIANLCYAGRLGLWGPATAFETREAFMSKMTEGGIAAMELVARDLKAQGLYTARALSFAGVEYDLLEHALTASQIQIYDAYADAWAIIHQNLEAALAATNVVDPVEDKALNSGARNAALSRFESSKQRFFGQLLISMKLPTLITEIERELEAGNAVVIQLVTTAEAMLGRRLAELSAEERANLDIELSPREYCIDYLMNAFPTVQMRTFVDEGGTVRSEPMIDEGGNLVHSADAIQKRDALVETLCAMPAVSSALDEIMRRFGTAEVAEVTGRTRRLVWDTNGTQKLETRSARTNLVETSAFMDGTKRILVFSDAGGTGRSYHADLGSKSAHMRRIHFLLEPGWKAAEAIQGLGRTNRTNQATAPVFRPCTTNCRGERRFISTIARRLDSLGALTRGQRQTGGQNLFNPADNLESSYAIEALNQWYHLLHQGKLTSVTLTDFCRMTALVLIERETGELLDKLPPIQRWLNRLLALRIAVQDAIFEEYLGLIEARLEAAREAGTLDLGVETIAAERMIVQDEHVLRTDPNTGAETRLVRLELHTRKRTTTHERLMRIWSANRDTRRLKNARSGRVALSVPSSSITTDDGQTIRMVQLVRPTGAERMREHQLFESHWNRCEPDSFAELWDAEVAVADRTIDTQTIHLATGLLLPVWDKLPDDSVQVWRVTGADGHAMLGRIVPARHVAKLAETMGVDVDIELSVAEIVAAARTREGITVPALGGARLMLSLVNGQKRIEVRDYPPTKLAYWKSLGVFTEIIAYKTRAFIPTDRAADIIAAMLG